MGSTGKGAEFPRRFGKYTLLSHLATGGMADVFLARQMGPGGFQKECVIKRVLPRLAQDPSNQPFIDMFLEEARIAARLSHPNIVHILDFGQIDGDYFLALEYIDGITLEGILDAARTSGQPALPWPIAVRIVSNAAEGLDHAHKAKDSAGSPLLLVHRDVSPSNIMVGWDGVAKVLDFGIAKAMSLSHGGPKVRTGIGVIKGKVPYMSPEQIQGLELDARSDVFSLAVVLYELTTGQRPFPGETTGKLTLEITSREPRPPETFNPSFPPDLHPILSRGLAKGVDKRYQSARDFKVDLEQFLADQHSSCSNYDVEAYLRELIPPDRRPKVEIPSGDELARLEGAAQATAPSGSSASEASAASAAVESAAGQAAAALASPVEAAAGRKPAEAGDRPSGRRRAALDASAGAAIDVLEAEERRRKKQHRGGGMVMGAIALLVVGTAVVFFVLHRRAVERSAGDGANASGNPTAPAVTAPATSPAAPAGAAVSPPDPAAAGTAVVAPAAGEKGVAKSPDAAHPADKPEAAKADSGKPEATKPEAAKPEAAKPEAAKPEAAKPAPKGDKPRRAKRPEEGGRPNLALPPPPPADPE